MVKAAVTFHGVRGSTPFGSADRMEFGGNTCCVVVEVEDQQPIILDMGTGLFRYALDLDDCALQASVLLTHLHWDHVAGLPFFSPVLCPGGELDIHGPADEGMNLEQAIRRLIQPPFFPVTIDVFAGDLRMHDLWDTDLVLGNAKVKARPVPHTSATSGYRLEINGHVIVYIPDHQQPIDGSMDIAESVLELADGADLLIHDGQYTPELFSERAHWGHSTPAFAIEVARRAGVSSLALFSHDPLHTDDELRVMEQAAQQAAASTGIDEVFSSREGMRIEFG